MHVLGSKLALFPYNRGMVINPIVSNSRGLYTHIRIPLFKVGWPSQYKEFRPYHKWIGFNHQGLKRWTLTKMVNFHSMNWSKVQRMYQSLQVDCESWILMLQNWNRYLEAAFFWKECERSIGRKLWSRGCFRNKDEMPQTYFWSWNSLERIAQLRILGQLYQITNN